MRFVFSKYFFILIAAGFIPLSLSWNFPILRWFVLAYDFLLICAALIDWRVSRLLPAGFRLTRRHEKRFAIGEANNIALKIENATANKYQIYIKDESPEQMQLESQREGTLTIEPQSTAALIYQATPQRRGRLEFGNTSIRYLSKLKLVWCQNEFKTETTVKVYPNIRRAREVELSVLGAQSLMAAQRRAILRGEGRDFESMRDYVRGDELRHVSWTATARRGKLVTRQYQIEKDQTILIALDAGRLMTGRIENESKLDSAIQATLALMSAAAGGGDNAGVVVFGRRIKRFVPPQRGSVHLDAVLEALYDVEPEMIEPSYSYAFQFISANLKRRALIVVLTDLVDEEGSKNLLEALKLLRPRHLPLITTIGDRDLKNVVQAQPESAQHLFVQGVAEEILHQREMALKNVEAKGGLALDVTARTLAPALLETYLRVKERGLL